MGSPEVPKTIEAFALFYGDLVSAKLNQFYNLLNKGVDSESGWTPWDKFLERSAYLINYSENGE